MVQALPSLVQPLSPSGCLTPPARKYPSHAHDGIHTPVGIFVVRHSGWNQIARTHYVGPEGQTSKVLEEPYELDLPKSVAFSTGVDARVGVGRFSIVPSFRFRYRFTNRDVLGPYAYGAPVVTLSTGLLGRVTF